MRTTYAEQARTIAARTKQGRAYKKLWTRANAVANVYALASIRKQPLPQNYAAVSEQFAQAHAAYGQLICKIRKQLMQRARKAR